MATAPDITGAPTRAPSNVIGLPGAAKRKPDNHRYAAQRRAGRALRQEQPWPGKVIPADCDSGNRFEVTKRTPELLIAMALVKVLTPEQRLKAQNIVHATNGISGDEVSREASVIMAKL